MSMALMTVCEMKPMGLVALCQLNEDYTEICLQHFKIKIVTTVCVILFYL